MAIVKKVNPDWYPSEKRDLQVGEVFEFPGNVEQLVKEGTVTLVDENGNEVSAFDTLGMITDRELEEFRTYKAQQKQEALKEKLEKENKELLAASEAIGQQPTEDAQVEIDAKKKAFGVRMAAARAAKREQQISA